MFAIKDICSTIEGHWCCECGAEPVCENCPYFDDQDPANCSTRLNNDIQYFLHAEKKNQQAKMNEQPYLPGIEQIFDLSKVRFYPGDYIVLNGVKYTYSDNNISECIEKNGQVSK